MMEKSSFKLLSDQEYEVARSGQYLLNLPIEVDESKVWSHFFKLFYDVSWHSIYIFN